MIDSTSKHDRWPLALGLLGSLLMWAALPPWNLWALAWVAPAPWLLLIRQEKLSGKRPYRTLWLAGLVFWLLAVHWLRLPHWATHFGWLALSFYLAFYLPVFVGLSRIAVHQLHVPLIVAAPVVWTGLELARGHLLTGFMMAALGHTQSRWIGLIQISDVGGAYAVSFVVMLVAACIARMVPWQDRPLAVWPFAPALVVLGLTIGYGHLRMSGNYRSDGPQIALIQGSIDADWKQDKTKDLQIFREYFGQSQKAVEKAEGQLDLIVWPETMYRRSLYSFDADFQVPAQWKVTKKELLEETPREVTQIVERLKAPVLLGVDARHFSNAEMRSYNSAIFADRDGEILGRYDKIHRVMFGEYVPLADRFPWLYRLSPMGGGLTPGHDPLSIEIEGIRYSANICFESVLSHVIRDQIGVLSSRNEEPDVLVNLTNDAWFWGSSELDMHLNCAVFRAVECRKPFLVAANAGITASIDADGKILDQLPRQQSGVVVTRVQLDHRKSFYLRWGDWPAGVCLLACLLLAAAGTGKLRANRKNIE